MAWPDAAAELLHGPRGRRLCWSLINSAAYSGQTLLWSGAMAGDLSGLLKELAKVIALTDLNAVAGTTEELALLPALAAATDAAMYWQEPDGVDRALAHPAAREALAPIAGAVASAPAAQWWPTTVALGSQRGIEWAGLNDVPRPLSGTAGELASWRAATVADEQSASTRPQDPSAPFSGWWWSTPEHSRLPATTRAIPGIGAVGLALVEDSHGWQQAQCRPIRPREGVRIYEVQGPDDWVELTASYPLAVTKSRRHDWWRVTGWSGTWLIPDFAAVAADYDAVHVSAYGYLTTAGRALPLDEPEACGSSADGPADGARTLLAGWNPDQTYWLADVLAPAGPVMRWARTEDEPSSWHPEGGRP